LLRVRLFLRNATKKFAGFNADRREMEQRVALIFRRSSYGRIEAWGRRHGTNIRRRTFGAADCDDRADTLRRRLDQLMSADALGWDYCGD
jgi:hypothetical protein